MTEIAINNTIDYWRLQYNTLQADVTTLTDRVNDLIGDPDIPGDTGTIDGDAKSNFSSANAAILYDVNTGVFTHTTGGGTTVNNSNGVVVQDIGLDDWGHVSSIGSVDLDNRYMRPDVVVTKTSGDITLNDNIALNIGSGDDAELFHDGANLYLDLNNDDNMYIRDGNSGNATRFTFSVSNGNFTATGNVTAYSDLRLKSNVEKITDAVKKVQSLNGVVFDRLEESLDQRGTGLIAQEVLAVLPEAVVEDENGYLSVAYGNLVGLLVESIKELKSEIEELKGSQ